MTPTVGSLFAGIGGFDLGFERAGFTTVWQVEINEWARKVLAKNFPHAERFSDIRDCGRNNLKPVDVVCGGFPCQDISNAGLRAGIEGERSGLVTEAVRVVDELRPKVVLLENVAALLGRGLSEVLGMLTAIGYDAEWEVVSAADVGAPHLRERIWITAYPASDIWGASGNEGPATPYGSGSLLAHAASLDGRAGRTWGLDSGGARECEPEWTFQDAPYADSQQYKGGASPNKWAAREELSADTARQLLHGGGERPESPGRPESANGGWWAVEPDVGRVAHGVSRRVDRLRGLGNAVVPQIPEMYARRIKQLLSSGMVVA